MLRYMLLMVAGASLIGCSKGYYAKPDTFLLNEMYRFEPLKTILLYEEEKEENTTDRAMVRALPHAES